MDITEYFLAFSIGVLIALAIAFLFRANFHTILLVILNSFVSLLLLVFSVFLGRNPHAYQYFFCGGFGIFGYIFLLLPIFC